MDASAGHSPNYAGVRRKRIMIDPRIELSSAGLQRKESILAMAKAHAHRRRLRRRTAQSLAAAVILALLLPALFLRHHRHQAKPIAVVPNVHPRIEHLTKSPFKSRVVVVKIETDPQI